MQPWPWASYAIQAYAVCMQHHCTNCTATATTREAAAATARIPILLDREAIAPAA